jgi:hypothetical protein
MSSFSVHFIKIDVKTDRLLRDMHGKHTAREIERSADSVYVPKMRRLVKKNKSVWTGRLLRSIGADVSGYSFVEGSVIVGAIGTDYAMDIEEGREPHEPNFDNLEKWARQKLKAKNPALTASRISKRIQKIGIDPKPFARPIIGAYERQFVDSLVRNLRRRFGT